VRRHGRASGVRSPPRRAAGCDSTLSRAGRRTSRGRFGPEVAVASVSRAWAPGSTDPG
jgi:hypothetical protein